MSARKVYTLACDTPFCAETFASDEGQVVPARGRASIAGWTSTLVPAPNKRGPARARDLCPACSDLPPLGILVDDTKPGTLAVTELRGPR